LGIVPLWCLGGSLVADLRRSVLIVASWWYEDRRERMCVEVVSQWYLERLLRGSVLIVACEGLGYQKCLDVCDVFWGEVKTQKSRRRGDTYASSAACDNSLTFNILLQTRMVSLKCESLLLIYGVSEGPGASLDAENHAYARRTGPPSAGI
jgi:hypothetical protein